MSAFLSPSAGTLAEQRDDRHEHPRIGQCGEHREVVAEGRSQQWVDRSVVVGELRTRERTVVGHAVSRLRR